MLQNVVQPVAFGATLDLNPLAVLIVTIAAGSLFGMIGMVLAAPIASAAVHISRDLALARAAPAAERRRSPRPYRILSRGGSRRRQLLEQTTFPS
jgi:predicted PurR-regulated permease PerM